MPALEEGTERARELRGEVLRVVQLERDAAPNELVRRHIDLVGQVVARVAFRFPRHVDRDELWNAGALGLVEASQRYDPEMGIPFARYATVRIRGAIIDATRNRDWVSRSVRRGLREMEEAEMAFATARGRTPDREELAHLLGMSVDEVEARQAQAASATLLYLDHGGPDDTSLSERLHDDDVAVSPAELVERRELVGTLREAVAHLPGVHGDVVRRYYLGGELLQEIAEDLGVTEARISQIRSEGLAALRTHFGRLYDGVPTVGDETPGKRVRAAYSAALATQSTWRTRLEAAERGVALDAGTSAG